MIIQRLIRLLTLVSLVATAGCSSLTSKQNGNAKNSIDSLYADATPKRTALKIGESIELYSTSYDSSREINVYLPDNYSQSNEPFSVLYVLDSNQWFLHAISLEKLLSGYKYTPRLIIVGINTNDDNRFAFFKDKEKLSGFLKNDVIPFIDQNYTTNKERILFGWQFAAAFALEELLSKHQLFHGYIAASPFPIDDLYPLYEGLLEDSNKQSPYLLFTASEDEQIVKQKADELYKILEKSTREDWIWDYRTLHSRDLRSASHRFTPIESLYIGLREFYYLYSVLEFNNLEQYFELGGYPFVQSYYKQRAARHGFNEHIPAEGMFNLMKMAIDADNVLVAKSMITRLVPVGLINKDDSYWPKYYAGFFMKNKEYAVAEKLYRLILEHHESTPDLYHKLSNSLLLQGKLIESRALLRKAYELSVELDDKNIETYRNLLEQIE